ncbi:GNAT family N-acetyltransferase [Parabacteroides pacaensis]|uniref:GNAT family N-acetyltransferase n=1 Tax=Parabacteroides pacaensis TaxID=2086575 RepID=UPI000D106509|nr:GNAT family N-acetyltransferase [Parabacteroides pacaensis]
MDYKIRHLKEGEHVILENMLYEAIYQSETVDSPLPYEVIFTPDLFIYISQWGRKGDYCMILEFENKIVGAVWCRTFSNANKGYGFIDCSTPELIISILKEHRNKQLGTMLMQKMLSHLKTLGYKSVSLSVSKGNYAIKLYQKFGFIIYEEREKDFLMIADL